MADTKTTQGAKRWLVRHVRSAKKVTLGLVVGGALVVILGLFIQVWADVGWVPLNELDAISYGDQAPIPGLGDFWGMMLIGVVLVPAILGGAGLSEARKRGRACKKLLPLLTDALRRDAVVIACSWSSADAAAVMHVKDQEGVQHKVRDADPQGQWQVSAGDPVGLWVDASGRLAVGTGNGIVGG